MAVPVLDNSKKFDWKSTKTPVQIEREVFIIDISGAKEYVCKHTTA
jgi:hypothetical protein